MVRAFSHAEVLWSLLSFLPRVERCQSSRYPGITCWIEVNSRGRRHISPRLEASSSSSSSEELGCVSDFQWFQLVPILDLTHCCKSIYEVSLANGLLCNCDSSCYIAAKTRLCKFSHPGVQSSRERLGMLGWFLALRTTYSYEIGFLYSLQRCKTLKHDSARWKRCLGSFEKLVCILCSTLEVFVLRNQSAITLFKALKNDSGQFWWLFWWWVHWLCLLCKP